ncbi:MAG: LPS export ABC transporter periplasmic protein LptC [Nitrospinaceae bacterium]|nr:MAG: LPS export ABC transporter periplasmic protein LptC [Nitrospinaceae bacterium]
MVNKARLFLLIAILGVVALFSHQFSSQISTPVGEVNLKPMKSGVDVEIENFKLINEDAGSKTWELTADRAQVLRAEDRTELEKVQLKLQQEAGREFMISADNGVIENENRDIRLEGHVRLVGQPSVLIERIESASQAAPAQ